MSVFQIYEEFSKLDIASKFYVSLFIALVIYLYKTFLTIQTGSDMQSRDGKLKAGEAIAKFDAYLSNYEHSNKTLEDKNKIVEKMGECYLYFDEKGRKAIRLFYSNRTNVNIRTLRSIINNSIDTFESPNKDKTIFDQISYNLSYLCKPIVSVFVSIVLLIVLTVHYSIFVSLQSTGERFILTINFLSVIYAFLVFAALINILFDNFKNFRVSNVKFWIISIGGIVAPPIAILFIYYDYLYLGFIIQIICSVLLFRKESSNNV